MGKQVNKRYNKHQRRPYPNNNDNRKPPFHHNRRTDRREGFVKRERQNFTAKIGLKEDQVGITEYVRDGEGFKGILKSRFSDFHVNEIDLTGNVLQLTSLEIPEAKEEPLSPEKLETAREEVKEVFTEEVWLKIKELAAAKSDNSQDSVLHFDVTEMDKDKRTHVHKIIKNLYGGKLVSSTVGGEQLEKYEDKKFIRVMKPKGRDRNRWTLPEEYVHFLVHKENLDTSEVAVGMANKLNLRPSQVNYCGTKDKRAKTTQKFCIKKRTPRQIVGSIKHMYGVKIGNFDFKKEVLKLGQLKGNRFRIALRHLTGDRKHIETALESVKDNGFINYFGLQRFGNSTTVPTYEVGVALLRSDYKSACELILKPREHDLPFLKAIRELWWKERNSQAAADMFRSDRFIEKKLLDGLAQYGENDYASALRKIPRNMLLLYPHAFQSLVFNEVASRRIKEFGLKLIPGDLVYRNQDDLDEDIEITEMAQEDQADGEEGDEDETDKTANNDECDTTKSETTDADKGNDSDKSTETTEANKGNDSDKSAEENAEANKGNDSDKSTETTESIFKRKVKALTEEDINSGVYSIYDVVLPLPGYDITYPNNDVASWYEEMLAKYDLTSEKLKHSVKTFSLTGAYRKLMLKPIDMSWEFRSYSTPEETLIISDFEQLKGKTLDDLKGKGSDAAGENKLDALVMDFCLPTAAYATMLLRELLKCDTSAAHQSTLGLAALKETITTETTPEDTASVTSEDTKAEKRSADAVDDEEDEENQVKSAKVAKNSEEHESV